jgi:ankyrin repeat protein
LLWAAESGNVEELRRLLTAQQEDLLADVNHRGLDQWTALHFAANEGSYEVVLELLRHPDIEREPLSSINRSPLHLAAIRGHTNIVRALVESSKPPLEVNGRDCDENTPLHYASEYGHGECIIYLVKEA